MVDKLELTGGDTPFDPADPRTFPAGFSVFEDQVVAELDGKQTAGAYVGHDGTPLVGDLVKVKSLSPLVVEGLDSGAYVAPGDLNTVGVDTYTASHIIVAGNAGRVVEMNVATANDVTVTSQPAGTVMEVHQYGAGATTLVADTGMTVLSPDTLVLDGQYATATLRWRTTTEVVVDGRLVAA